jgi:hypothetical protein
LTAKKRKSFDRFKARVRGTSKVFSRRLGGWNICTFK